MLHTLFAPAMHFMSRLRFAMKLGLIGVLFTIPLGTVVYFLYSHITEDITLAKTERQGVREIVLARQLLEMGQAHRKTHQLALNGDAAAKEKLPGIAAGIDKHIEDMRRIDVASSSIGTGLSEVMKSWTEIKKNIDTYNARTSFETHTSLLNRITEILPAAAEASGLTTDPDIDANYVGKVMTLRVPATFKALGMFRSNGFQVLNRHSLSPEERIELNILNDRYTKEYQNSASKLDES